MILLTGGSGVLGSELRKHLDVYAPTKEQFDITRPQHVDCELIIHAAAYTDVNKAEEDRYECYKLNVLASRLIASFKKPTIYISTDSVFDGVSGNYCEMDIPYPKNFYSLSKLLGEREIIGEGNVVIRTSFRERPWKYDGAYVNRFSSAEYVDDIAKKIVRVVKNYRNMPRIIHVGGDKLSHYELAVQTKPNVSPLVYDGLPVHRPFDLSLDTSLYGMLFNE